MRSVADEEARRHCSAASQCFVHGSPEDPGNEVPQQVLTARRRCAFSYVLSYAPLLVSILPGEADGALATVGGSMPSSEDAY